MKHRIRLREEGNTRLYKCNQYTSYSPRCVHFAQVPFSSQNKMSKVHSQLKRTKSSPVVSYTRSESWRGSSTAKTSYNPESLPVSRLTGLRKYFGSQQVHFQFKAGTNKNPITPSSRSATVNGIFFCSHDARNR